MRAGQGNHEGDGSPGEASRSHRRRPSADGSISSVARLLPLHVRTASSPSRSASRAACRASSSRCHSSNPSASRASCWVIEGKAIRPRSSARRAIDAKSDAGGDVARAGVDQDVLDHPMVAIAVEVAARGADRAVVDQQCVSAFERLRETIDEREGSHGNQHLAVLQHRLSVPRRLDLDEPFAFQPDADLAIASHPAEREVVQQLVGDDDVRSAFEVGRCADALDRVSAERAPGLTSIAS